ncbi:hypothetical protein KSS87_006357, partial [Heliosperma pusillum]
LFSPISSTIHFLSFPPPFISDFLNNAPPFTPPSLSSLVLL